MLRYALLFAVLPMAAGAAWAQADATSSSSFSIQVTIPPLGAASAAQDAGAVGGWTVFSPSGGLMVDDQSGAEQITIYHSDANRFRVTTPDGQALPAQRRTNDRGLTALQFNTLGLGARDRSRPNLIIAGF